VLVAASRCNGLPFLRGSLTGFEYFREVREGGTLSVRAGLALHAGRARYPIEGLHSSFLRLLQRRAEIFGRIFAKLFFECTHIGEFGGINSR
jgi:hypothetical protein